MMCAHPPRDPICFGSDPMLQVSDCIEKHAMLVDRRSSAIGYVGFPREEGLLLPPFKSLMWKNLEQREPDLQWVLASPYFRKSFVPEYRSTY